MTHPVRYRSVDTETKPMIEEDARRRLYKGSAASFYLEVSGYKQF